MPQIIALITKAILTEEMMIKLLIALGDYLVGSSKNKLDDKLWFQVRKTLDVK